MPTEAAEAKRRASLAIIKQEIALHESACEAGKDSLTLHRFARILAVILGIVMTGAGVGFGAYVKYTVVSELDKRMPVLHAAIDRSARAADVPAPPWRMVPSAHAAADIGKAAP
jgi:hypothetical protein